MRSEKSRRSGSQNRASINYVGSNLDHDQIMGSDARVYDRSVSTPDDEDIVPKSRVSTQEQYDSEEEDAEFKKVTILKEPDTCTRIPSLEEEKEQNLKELSQLPLDDEVTLTNSNTAKPEDIYLLHCQKFSKGSVEREDIEAKPYMFNEGDFESGVLSEPLIDRMLEDGAFYGPKIMDPKEKLECFQTEGHSMRVFTDYVHLNGQIFMVQKTWQKVTFQTPQQRQTFGNMQENNDRKRDIARTQTISDKMSSKNTPNYKETLAAGGASQNPFSKNEFYIKTIQILSAKGKKLISPILTETVQGTFEQMRLYDTSFVQFESKIFYFKRLYMDKETGDQSEEEQPITAYEYEEYSAQQIRDDQSTSQYNRKKKMQDRHLEKQRKNEEERLKKDKKFMKDIQDQTIVLQLFSLDLPCKENNFQVKETAISGFFFNEKYLCGGPDNFDVDLSNIQNESVPAVRRNLTVGNRQKQAPGMVANYALKQIAEARPQYCINFSMEFGQDLLDEYPKNYYNWTEFLKEQFICVQRYMKASDDSKKSQQNFKQHEQMRIFKLDYYNSSYSEKQDLKDFLLFDSQDVYAHSYKYAAEIKALDLERQIQFANHITDWQYRHLPQKVQGEHKEQLGPKQIIFLVSNMFGLIEIECTLDRQTQILRGDPQDKTYVTNWPRSQKDVLQKLWNHGGICPQRHFVQLGNSDEDGFQSIEQYYFVDSRNQIQLIYPKHISKVETLKIIEIIQEQRNIIQKDFRHYKKIHCISTTAPESWQAGFKGQFPAETDPNYLRCKELDKNGQDIYYQQVVQKIRDLKAVLAHTNIKDSQSVTFLKDKDGQTLVIQEPKSQSLTLFQKQDHNCEKCELSHNPQHQKEKLEASTKLLEQKTNTDVGRLINQKGDCEPGIKKAATMGKNELGYAKNQPQEKQEQFSELCQHCGDEHEDAYTVYEPLNDDGLSPNARRLSDEEKKNHVLIDDFGGSKIRVKTYEIPQHDDLIPQQQVRLELYQRSEEGKQSGSYVIFVFSIYNAAYDGNVSDDMSNIMVRKSYIFVRKSQQEMTNIFASGCRDVIIKENDQVLMLKEYHQLTPIPFKDIRDYQFAKELAPQDGEDEKVNNYVHDLSPFKPIKLTLCKVNDDKQRINFVPFIYQVQQNPDQNRILVFDIPSRRISQKLSIAPTQDNQQHLYEDDRGYNHFMICRTSDIFEGDMTRKGSFQSARYQIFMLYTEKIGRFFNEEFLIRADPIKGAKIQTIGQRHIILSKSVIQAYDWRNISDSTVFPFFNKNGHIKGCSLMLKTTENSYHVIAMQDQDENNIYTHRSSIILSGQIRFVLDPEKDEQYVLVISTMLRRKQILQNLLNRYEAFVVLKQALDTVMSMRMPDLEYLALNPFDVLKRKDFFRPQQILLGKSICDICLSEPQSILEALELRKLNEKNDSGRAWGSIIEQITQDDRIRRETFIETKFYPQSLIINLDLDFTGTINRAIQAQNTKSLKMLLEHVMESSEAYKNVLMFDICKVLESNQIQVNDFFNVTQSEKLQFSAFYNENMNQKMCNLEVEVKHPELPVFNNKQFDYFTINDFENFMNIETDIVSKIIQFNPQSFEKQTDEEMSSQQEVEYSFIDFTWLMIGEKLKPLDTKRKKAPKFDDYFFSDIIASQEHKMSFFACDSVKAIIESQWDTTQYVQTKIFGIYFSLFVIPMCISSFKITPFVDTLMFQIAIIPGFMLLVIESIQLKTDPTQYCQGWWNFIDLFQLVIYVFLLWLRTKDVNNTALYYPELKLVNIILAFLKTMYFMRIFENFGFLVQMIGQCLKAIIPFTINYFVFLFVFSICFVILRMEIDDEVNEAKNLGYFAKTFLQTFRTSIGELGMPKYNNLVAKKNGGIFKAINIFLIWLCWFIQTFFMLVVMLNFLIAVITSNYEKVKSEQAIIAYLNKASLNAETYMLLQCFCSLPEYRCIVLQKSRLMDSTKDDMDRRFDDLKKFIGKKNYQLMGKHEKIGFKIDKIMDMQRDMDKDMRSKFEELTKTSEQIKDEICFRLDKAYNMQAPQVASGNSGQFNQNE